MNRKVFLAIAALILVASCSSNKYESAIANCVQTIGDAKLDLNFKAIEIKELSNVTVADSLAIYKSAFEAGSKHLEDAIKLLEAQEGDAVASILESNKSNLSLIKDAYDASVKVYEGRAETEVLAVLVECKYTIELKGTGLKTESTNTFVLSADGKKCYSVVETEAVSDNDSDSNTEEDDADDADADADAEDDKDVDGEVATEKEVTEMKSEKE